MVHIFSTALEKRFGELQQQSVPIDLFSNDSVDNKKEISEASYEQSVSSPREYKKPDSFYTGTSSTII